MKRILFSLFFSAGLMLNAQLCTPDTTIKIPGFYPSQLADGAVGVPYDQTVMILSFKDTSAIVGGSKQKVTIDSLKLTKVIGLPTGMGYTCYEPRCIYLPSTVRCIKLNGTPNQAGLFPLKFAVTAYAKLNGFFPVAQPDTIKNFSLLITGTSHAQTIVNEYNVTVYPNPVKEVIHVAHYSGKQPQVSTVTGSQIALDWYFENGLWTAATQKMSSGVYRINVNGINRLWIKE
jgi:hypothetical protein